MSKVIVPENYKAALNPYDTQRAIMLIHSIFEKELCSELDLSRVSAPLMVPTASGLNDNLNGVERPVGFDIKETGEDCQVVQSLAKWKRKALKDYDFHVGKGLYTDMNAIRRDEEMDNLHSVYVDQWDWEKVIRESDRTLNYLKKVVQKIVNAIVDTEDIIREVYPELNVYAPKKRQIKYLTTQELEDMYPDKTAKEREDAVTEQYKTVCLM
ncbi:MAG: aspartate--ammonia ligase, partial [Firmicutes bacterium]|nr:aspartate--ammonia ligase [Bacillota bacterium]